MFVDREKEMTFLEKEHRRQGYSFVIIYGRRRIGKTELIKKFIKGRESVYFLVPKEASRLQLNRLIERVASHCGERTPKIKDWVDGMDYIGEKMKQNKIVLSIDEFPYLVDSNKSTPSYFQHLVDNYLKDSDSMLILSGSSIGIMESEVLGHKSPLYGRRTGQIDLGGFDFERSRLMIKRQMKDSVEAFSIFGRVPMYLGFFNNKQSVAKNAINRVLDKNSSLYKEPELILKQEFREPSTYMSIMTAIARGYTTLGSISSKVGVPPGTLSKYIKNLIKIRLIKREVSVTERDKKSKRSLYFIRDPLFRFWFKFVEPNRSDVEFNPSRFFKSKVAPNLSSFVSKTFENTCKEFVQKKFDYGIVGKWWWKGDEIDVVALDESRDKILFAECKWQKKVDAKRVLSKLKKKSSKVDWKKGSRKEKFLVFARSFKNKKKDCYDLEDLDEFFKRK